MKKTNLFRLLFCAMLVTAFTAFTGCTDNDDDNRVDNPTLAVTPASLTFDENGGSKTFDIATDGKWAITGAENASWLAITPALTGTGSQTITVTVGQSATPNTVTLKVKVFTTIFGIEKEVDSKDVTISQTPGGEQPSDELIYGNNFDKAAATKTFGTSGESWPYLDQFDGWQNQTGSGASTVTYTYANMSVRQSGRLSGGYDGASGANKIFFGKAPATFDINKITLPAGKKNFKITFGGQFYDGGTNDNVFKTDKFLVAVGNGTEWSNSLTYTKIGGSDAADPNFVLFEVNFTLKEAVSELSIRFTAELASFYSMDDVKLTEGVGGQEVEIGGGTPVDPDAVTPIKDITAGNTFTAEGLIVATTTKSFLIQDATGTMLVYMGAAPVNAVGDKVKVKGKTSSYGGLIQFALDGDIAPTVTKTGTGTVTPPQPTVLDAAGMDAYKNDIKVKYIQYTGTLTISGNYYNVAVDGATIKGSISYPDAALVPASFNNAVVVVTGYAAGTASNGAFLTTVATEVKLAAGQDGPAIVSINPMALTFAAAGESKTAQITLRNADNTTLKLTPTAPFTATVVNNVITIVAPANATTAAINGTLKVDLLKSDNSVADTETMTLTQLAPTSAGTFEVKLTNAEIAGLSNQAYGAFNFSNSFGDWTGRCGITVNDKTNGSYLQINFKSGASDTALNSRIVTPAVDGKIQKVVIETQINTIAGRYMMILNKDYTYAVGATASQLEDAALAKSNVTTDKGQTLTFDNLDNLNLSQIALFPGGGACYIKSITLTCVK